MDNKIDSDCIAGMIPGAIKTYTGKMFYPLNPQQELICIEDIAHGLSMKCRFNGHTKKFYSVAQHSVIVSYICEPEDALWGLLHDAPEAYLIDIPKPLKILPELRALVEVENKVQEVICSHFGLPLKEPASVRHADQCALYTEKRDVMPRDMTKEFSYPLKYKTLSVPIIPLLPDQAERLFLDRYYELVPSKTYKNNSKIFPVTEW